jgi:hypothetical protein
MSRFRSSRRTCPTSITDTPASPSRIDRAADLAAHCRGLAGQAMAGAHRIQERSSML